MQGNSSNCISRALPGSPQLCGHSTRYRLLRLDGLVGPVEVDFLPCSEVAWTEESPEIEDYPLVKGILQLRVSQVGDAMMWHEFPGGGVARDQIEVWNKQQQDNCGEDGYQEEGHEQENIALQPVPGLFKVEAWPFNSKGNKLMVTDAELVT